jgi:phage terminase small subunit
MPQLAAAWLRERPSSTRAMASIRRAAGACRVRPASRRNSAADSSVRVIANAAGIPPSARRFSAKRITAAAPQNSQVSQKSAPLV